MSENMPNVILYGTLFCPYCYAAKRLLKQKGIKYQEIRVDKQANLKQEMIAKSGRFTVPQIFIGDYHIGGYDDLALLEGKGKLDSLLTKSIA
jgi:glutaredoxin 3